jgi:hypothetical protein
MVRVHGTVRYTLQMSKSSFGVEPDDNIEWLGVFYTDAVGVPQEEQDMLFGGLVRSFASPFHLVHNTLMSLKFPLVDICLEVLENILDICPNLIEISCTLSCSSSDILGYMTRLSGLSIRDMCDSRPRCHVGEDSEFNHLLASKGSS